MKSLQRHLVLAATVLVGGASMAFADPPGRVGRLSFVEGNVSLSTPDQNQWAVAKLNFPVIAGDVLWTDPHSRAEIQVGPIEVRMDERTELDFPRLDDETLALRVDPGVINVHLGLDQAGTVEVITAAGRTDLSYPGSYHIEVGEAGPNGSRPRIKISVLEGEAHLTGPRASVTILAGEGALVGTDPFSLTLVEADATPFDNWALGRERRETTALAPQYVSPEMTGYQDLDAYGQWSTLPDYGPVWIPTVMAPDWVPYQFGYWAYVDPWGWTWIDDAPWGFAPFHYGRWVDLHGRWGWCPGRRVERPVYAPALVAFIGNPGIGTMIADSKERVSAIGWVPLAPHEAFHPYYPASEAYVRNVNADHVANMNEINIANVALNAYANRHAVTVVPNAAFAGGAAVHRAILPADPEQLMQTSATTELGRLQPTPIARGNSAMPGTPPGAWSPPPYVSGGGRNGPPSYPRAEPGGISAPAEVRPPMQTLPIPQSEPRASPQAAPQQAVPPPIVQHPVQQSLPAPTPQGWIRTPQQQPQHEAQPHDRGDKPHETPPSEHH